MSFYGTCGKTDEEILSSKFDSILSSFAKLNKVSDSIVGLRSINVHLVNIANEVGDGKSLFSQIRSNSMKLMKQKDDYLVQLMIRKVNRYKKRVSELQVESKKWKIKAMQQNLKTVKEEEELEQPIESLKPTKRTSSFHKPVEKKDQDSEEEEDILTDDLVLFHLREEHQYIKHSSVVPPIVSPISKQERMKILKKFVERINRDENDDFKTKSAKKELLYNEAKKQTELIRHQYNLIQKTLSVLKRKILFYEKSSKDVSPTLQPPPPNIPLFICFTDIEASTHLWDSNPQEMEKFLYEHNSFMRCAIQEFDGYEVKNEGDGFYIVFKDPISALRFSNFVQLNIMKSIDWDSSSSKLIKKKVVQKQNEEEEESDDQYLFMGFRIKIGLHYAENPILVQHQSKPEGEGAGSPDYRPDYIGPPINETARICGLGQGGMTLVSEQFLDQYNLYKQKMEEVEEESGRMFMKQISNSVKLKGVERKEFTIYFVLPNELKERYDFYISQHGDTEKVDPSQILNNKVSKKSNFFIFYNNNNVNNNKNKNDKDNENSKKCGTRHHHQSYSKLLILEFEKLKKQSSQLNLTTKVFRNVILKPLKKEIECLKQEKKIVKCEKKKQKMNELIEEYFEQHEEEKMIFPLGSPITPVKRRTITRNDKFSKSSPEIMSWKKKEKKKKEKKELSELVDQLEKENNELKNEISKLRNNNKKKTKIQRELFADQNNNNNILMKRKKSKILRRGTIKSPLSPISRKMPGQILSFRYDVKKKKKKMMSLKLPGVKNRSFRSSYGLGLKNMYRRKRKSFQLDLLKRTKSTMGMKSKFSKGTSSYFLGNSLRK